MGELVRHLETTAAALAEEAGARAARLREELLAARPTSNADLSESATRILETLGRFELDADPPAPEEFGGAVADSAQSLGAISRIVLGR